jgi:hypothetical protein
MKTTMGDAVKKSIPLSECCIPTAINGLRRKRERILIYYCSLLFFLFLMKVKSLIPREKTKGTVKT